MITYRTRRALAVSALMAVATFWLVERQDTDDQEPITGLDTRLDYALQNFEMLSYDEKGIPAVRMWAPRLINDATTRIGRVEKPRLEINHDGFQWNIIADTATVSNDQEEVLLGGRVTLDRTSSANDDLLTIETAEVTLEVTPRIAYSNEPVQLEDPSGTLQAVGFRADMINNHYELNNNVQGTYDAAE